MIHEELTSRKRVLEARLKSLREALTDAQRLNKALKTGRVPNVVVSVLQTLEDAGLGQYFIVVGTHALYAYETAAGVRIVQAALATHDMLLLKDGYPALYDSTLAPNDWFPNYVAIEIKSGSTFAPDWPQARAPNTDWHAPHSQNDEIGRFRVARQRQDIFPLVAQDQFNLPGGSIFNRR